MEEQLTKAFPIHTYPHAVVLPDGGLAVSAGKLLVSRQASGAPRHPAGKLHAGRLRSVDPA